MTTASEPHYSAVTKLHCRRFVIGTINRPRSLCFRKRHGEGTALARLGTGQSTLVASKQYEGPLRFSGSAARSMLTTAELSSYLVVVVRRHRRLRLSSVGVANVGHRISRALG